MKKRLIISFCILSLFSARAETGQVRFKRYSTDDGLSQSTVRCFAQDQDGFVWVGTQDGLNRFDGYSFKVYRHIARDTTSLLSNDIYALFKDSKGVLWVGTTLSLSTYDAEHDRFTHRLTHHLIRSTTGLTVRSIFEDSKGNIWVGCDGGGVFLFPGNGEYYINYIHDPDNPSSLSNNNVWSIVEDAEGHIWIATFGGGLNRFDEDGNRFVHYHAEPNSPGSLSHNSISSLWVDTNGSLWVATYGGGLNQYDSFQDRFDVYSTATCDIKTDILYDVYEDSQQTLWIATDGEGLLRFNRNEGTFEAFQHSSTNQHSISNNKVITVFEDEQTNLWIGNFQGGVNFTSVNSQKAFHTLHHQTGVANTISHPIVTAILVDHLGDLWIGTDGGGLNRVLKNSQRIITYKHDLKDPGSLSHDAVLSLFEDHSGTIWVGTYLGGLNRFVRKDERFVHYEHQPDNPHSLSNNDVRHIMEDKQNRLWVSTNGGGVSVLNVKRTDFEHIRRDIANPDSSLALDWVRQILQDKNDIIWIGTYSGLSRFDTRTKTITNFLNSADPHSLSSDAILALHLDMYNQLWVGTDRGLNLFNYQRNDFERFSTDQGLPSDVINGILEDAHGNLWLSTNNGVSRFTPPAAMMAQNENMFRNYNVSDGLQGNAFIDGSCFSDQNGILYMGGTNGLTYFYPDSIHDNPYFPNVVITDFQLFNQSVTIGSDNPNQFDMKKSIIQTDTLLLHYTDDVFSFEFAALHYVAPQNNQYAYQMVGFNQNWVHCKADKRFVTYTNLDPGHYAFKVKAANNDGVWNPETKSLVIIIEPPFWQTWWFRIVMMCLLLSLIMALHLMRVRRLKAHRKQLQDEVAARTAELRAKKDELEKSNRLLKKEVREHQKTEVKLAESNQELEQFAYVASHDLQEPLRMVSSYLSLLVRRNQDNLDQDSKEFIEFAVDGAKRMQVMIQDLLTYSRVRTKGKPFEACACNELMEHVLRSLKVAIEESNAKIEYDDLPVIQSDVVQFERLLQNLVGNAIKYRGEKTPEVYVSAKKEGAEWIFCVADNGIGISPEYHDRVFGIFQRLHGRDTYSGTGIGLAVCKRIVERHNGKIWIESEEGIGSRFYFSIPDVEQKDSTQE